MRLTSRVLVCGLLAACCSSLGLAAADNAACTVASKGVFDPSALSVPEPVYLTGPCVVSRNCDYPPPASISCSGTSTCSSGTYNYGWVECDGVRTYCSPAPPPPGCVGSCFSTLQCWDICNAGGVEPSTYQCNISGHCCMCYYN